MKARRRPVQHPELAPPASHETPVSSWQDTPLMPLKNGVSCQLDENGDTP